VLGDRRDPDFFMCTMAAGVSRARIVESICRELTQSAYSHLARPGHFRTAASTNPDPTCVRTFEDHLAFYQDRSKRELTAFLTASGQTRPWSAAIGETSPSVEAELDLVTARLAAAGYAAIAVDCTPAMVRETGLVVVKVVVPGLQPLHAGHGRAPLGGRRAF